MKHVKKIVPVLLVLCLLMLLIPVQAFAAAEPAIYFSMLDSAITIPQGETGVFVFLIETLYPKYTQERYVVDLYSEADGYITTASGTYQCADEYQLVTIGLDTAATVLDSGAYYLEASVEYWADGAWHVSTATDSAYFAIIDSDCDGDHNFVEEDMLIGPTPDEEGVALYCCDNCGHMIYESVPTSHAVRITKQPADGFARLGEPVTTTVTATGDGLTYQWYISDNGGASFGKSSITKKTYSYTMTEAKSGRQAYCVVTDRYGNTETSNTVTLSMMETDMPFTDVSPSKYYYEPVIWAVENGITTGTTATTFEPNKACTRWQVVTFLWRAAGCPEPTITTHSFTDVSAGNKAVLWAVEQGITSGTTETTFSPDETCNRWQIVTFLWRFAGCPEPTATGHSFTDVSANNKAVLWAVENGITNGKNATTFAPNDPCTRGQVVTFLYRYMVE